MATVSGYTAESVDAMLGELLESIHIETGGQLIATKKNGEDTNVGTITPASSAVNAAWPVGSIYINVNPTSPATLFGLGTWVRHGEGRVLVSQDATQTEFDAAGEVGGEKTHTLTVSEMPSHNHSGTTSSAGQHNHTISTTTGAGSSTTTVQRAAAGGADSGGPIGQDGAHTHTIPSQGGGAAHNVLQPYIVVYMWRRTA